MLPDLPSKPVLLYSKALSTGGVTVGARTTDHRVPSRHDSAKSGKTLTTSSYDRLLIVVPTASHNPRLSRSSARTNPLSNRHLSSTFADRISLIISSIRTPNHPINLINTPVPPQDLLDHPSPRVPSSNSSCWTPLLTPFAIQASTHLPARPLPIQTSEVKSSRRKNLLPAPSCHKHCTEFAGLTSLKHRKFPGLVRRRTVAAFIHEQTEALKEDHSDPSESPDDAVSIWSDIDIGSRLKPVSFSMLEQEMSQDPAFGRFRVKFSAFLSQFLTAHNYDLPNGKPLRFHGTPGNIQGEGRKTNLGAILCKASCSEAPARM
ncbi:hypothetical protein B0H13DRAFT_1910869 [Mycena leptocephala]|nr:hypothetical protein B0H13DRAFT_1910869 [Mycena leptocephala]